MPKYESGTKYEAGERVVVHANEHRPQFYGEVVMHLKPSAAVCVRDVASDLLYAVDTDYVEAM